MKKNILLFFLLCQFQFMRAQILRPDPVVDRQSGGFIEFQPKPEVTESFYMDSDWAPGKVFLKSGYAISGYALRYDLKNSQIEIQTPAGVKIAGDEKFQSFEIYKNGTKRIFLNATQLNLAGAKGIVEEIFKGTVSLYAKPYIEVLPANYNPALNIGSRNDQFLVKESLLLVKDNVPADVTKSGKKILEYFGDQADSVKLYAKSNKLSYKRKADIADIISFYNSLLAH